MEKINIEQVLIPNGIAITLLLILMLSSQRIVKHTLLGDRLFYFMVNSTLLQSIVEIAAYIIDGKVNYYLLALLLNSFLYINNIMFSFSWIIYADYKVFSDTKRIRQKYFFIAIPALLVILGSVINLFTPVFYQLSIENVYQRTNLFIVPYFITYIYLLYGVILIYKNRKKADKYLFLPALIFMIPILIGSVLQYLFYGLSLVWVSVSIALVSLYINIQNEVSYTDELSGLFTRHYLYQYLNLETKRSNSKTKLAGIMLDIDKFKTINDSFGHLVGDEAINCTGKILRSAITDHAIATRYAGDEFIVLERIDNEKEILQTIEKINQAVEEFNQKEKKEYVLSLSKGYSIYNLDEDTIDSFLGRMDAAMYADKRKKA